MLSLSNLKKFKVGFNECCGMDELVNVWMDGWMIEQVLGWVGWVSRCVGAWVCG
jgi:hypothetical protein